MGPTRLQHVTIAAFATVIVAHVLNPEEDNDEAHRKSKRQRTENSF
jgi:nucleoside permease NupC